MKHQGMRRFGSLGIRMKLMLLFMLLILVITGIFSMANLEFSNRETAAQAQYTTQQALQQSASFVQNKCSAVVDILDIMSSNETIQELVTEPLIGYSGNLVKWWADATKLNTVLFNMRSNKDISRFHLYFANGLSRVSDNNDFTLLDEVAGEGWCKDLLAGQSGYRWYPPGRLSKPVSDGMITVVRKMPSADSLREIIGIIRADMPASLIKDILNQGQYAPSATLVLTNADGELICASDNFQIRDTLVVKGILADSAHSNLAEGECRTMAIEGVSYLAGTQAIRRSDWILTVFIPSGDVLSLGTRTQKRILVILLLMAPLSLPVAFLAAQSSTTRIRHLANRMRNFGVDGAPDQRKRRKRRKLPTRGDEIDELEYDYEEMLERIDALMADMYGMGRENKNLELKALQAQINPHFLYNTLDLINMMGLQYNRPEIVSLVKALAAFYRLSLGKGEDIVTIRNELDLVRSYLYIQNMRFDDCVTLRMEVPDDLMDVRMPKIILQPLVENAILHGILESERETGTITISGWRTASRIILSIRDDGRGMPDEVMRRLVAHPALLQDAGEDEEQRVRSGFADDDACRSVGPAGDDAGCPVRENAGAPVGNDAGGPVGNFVEERVSQLHGDTTGYGVRNIDERLKILYGIQYGLRVDSVPEQGTTVFVVLPG